VARFLVRLENKNGHTPQETGRIAQRVRKLLGSKDSIGHLRVSRKAVEFDLFASDQEDLAAKKSVLEEKVARVLTVKPLDVLPSPREKLEVLREGISLFNEERYWECHEVLEQIWHPARGVERSTIQGLILTAAALVHHQKGEDEVCLRMLRKAFDKLGSQNVYEAVDLKNVRAQIQEIIASKNPKPFTIFIPG
jgi:hypothetical protein